MQLPGGRGYETRAEGGWGWRGRATRDTTHLQPCRMGAVCMCALTCVLVCVCWQGVHGAAGADSGDSAPNPAARADAQSAPHLRSHPQAPSFRKVLARRHVHRQPAARSRRAARRRSGCGRGAGAGRDRCRKQLLRGPCSGPRVLPHSLLSSPLPGPVLASAMLSPPHRGGRPLREPHASCPPVTCAFCRVPNGG